MRHHLVNEEQCKDLPRLRGSCNDVTSMLASWKTSQYPICDKSELTTKSVGFGNWLQQSVCEIKSDRCKIWTVV